MLLPRIIFKRRRAAFTGSGKGLKQITRLHKTRQVSKHSLEFFFSPPTMYIKQLSILQRFTKIR